MNRTVRQPVDKKRTYFFVYGFAEGPRHSTLMSEALKRAEYTAAKSMSEAGVIIAHSGGAYLISPDKIHTKLLIVGPTFWAGKGLLKSFIQNLQHGYSLFVTERSRPAWLHKMAWHSIYALTRPLSSFRMWRGWLQRHDWWRKLNQSGEKIIIIRNNNDAFCGPDISLLLSTDIIFKNVPGFHDDLWLNPKPYVELIK